MLWVENKRVWDKPAKSTPRKAEAAWAVRGRGWVTTTHAGDGGRAADLVDRQFVATRPNQLWVSDFTYVATRSGFGRAKRARIGQHPFRHPVTLLMLHRPESARAEG